MPMRRLNTLNKNSISEEVKRSSFDSKRSGVLN